MFKNMSLHVYRAVYAVMILAFAALSCDKAEVVELPQSIQIKGNKELVMGYGTTEEVEFVVSPSDAAFNHDVTSVDCQVKLELRGTSHDGSFMPSYYRLSGISLVSAEEGRYVARITDQNISRNYDDKLVFRLAFRDQEHGSRIIYSDVFRVRMEKGPFFKTLSFKKEDNEGAVNQDITVDVSSGNTIFKSPFIGSPHLVASFESNGAQVYVDGVEQISGVTVNDFSRPVTYTVKSKIEYTFTVGVVYSDLPKVFVETSGGKQIPSKWEDWLSGSYIRIYNPDWSVAYEGGTGIRGRGNSTWTYPKKPYALKLDSKAEILGMPKHKRWVLLANWMDRTLLRNAASFNLASRTGLAYTPRGQFVELFINGVHQGNYFLCEHIKVDKNRVNIDELDEDEVDGGYILELDAYYDEVNKFRSAVRQLPYMFKDPDEVNEEQFAFIQDYVDNFENSLYDDSRFSSGEYLEYIDVQSFADWWLVMELTGIWEPNHPKSTYMHKDKGGKLTMGPVWDFDWETYMPADWFRIKDALYYGRLFQDRRFVDVVKERWAVLKPEFLTFPEFIRSQAEIIRNSESMNHDMWPVTIYVNQDENMSFDAAVDRMIKSYESKLEWMDKEISRL